VTWLRVITTYILATHFVKHNTQHLAVNEHTSTRQYEIISTKHRQQNAGEITENCYLSANSQTPTLILFSLSLKKRHSGRFHHQSFIHLIVLAFMLHV
jgi:hypothetical protein